MKVSNSNNNYIVSRQYREVGWSPIGMLIITIVMGIMLVCNQLVWGTTLQQYSTQQLLTLRQQWHSN